MSEYSQSFTHFHGDDLAAIESDYYLVMISFYKTFLDAKTSDEIEVFVPTGLGEEVWELPTDFEVQLTLDNVNTKNFSIGRVVFGVWLGERVIAEQNASPIIFMRKYANH